MLLFELGGRGSSIAKKTSHGGSPYWNDQLTLEQFWGSREMVRLK